MFGIGFTELLLIAVIAILFLGPDKLPEAMVQIAKLFKSVKKTVNEAKSSLEEEMRIADLKEEAMSYKRQLDSATEELQGFKNISMDDILDEPAAVEESPASAPAKNNSPYADDNRPTVQVEPKMESVTLKKKERTFKTTDTDEEKAPMPTEDEKGNN